MYPLEKLEPPFVANRQRQSFTAGQALSETMISGNIARMLHNVVAVSAERIDTGALVLPWLRVGNLHFS